MIYIIKKKIFSSIVSLKLSKNKGDNLNVLNYLGKSSACGNYFNA